MRFACVSDLHGQLPDLSGLDFDALLIGGDVTPITARQSATQAGWLGGPFRNWLERVGRPVVGVAGNHDRVFAEWPGIVPELPWTYLQDSGCEAGGFKVWGSPWQPRFHNWAFNAEEPELERYWSLIPDDTDVLLLHGPPYGYGDLSPFRNVRTGSPSLTRRIEQVRPRLVVYGHIHSGYGVRMLGPSVLVNAALCDEDYRPVNEIMVVEIV